MNMLTKVLLVLVMAGALVTMAMEKKAEATRYKDVFVTKRLSKVYPNLRTLERFFKIAAYHPKKINRFMRRNQISHLGKGRRVIRMRSIMLDHLDAVVYEVRIPSRNKYGYILARNVKKLKYSPERKRAPKVEIEVLMPALVISLL